MTLSRMLMVYWRVLAAHILAFSGNVRREIHHVITFTRVLFCVSSERGVLSCSVLLEVFCASTRSWNSLVSVFCGPCILVIDLYCLNGSGAFCLFVIWPFLDVSLHAQKRDIMPNFRWPLLLHDLALTKEVVSKRPESLQTGRTFLLSSVTSFPLKRKQ